MLKELLYTGLGGAIVVKTKVEEELNRLKENGKLDNCDVKSMMESLEQKGKEEDLKMRENLKSIIKEVVEELQLATKKDIQELKEDLK